MAVSGPSGARSFYRNHLLSCQPMRHDDGRFQARVVVTSLGGGKTRSQGFFDLVSNCTRRRYYV